MGNGYSLSIPYFPDKLRLLLSSAHLSSAGTWSTSPPGSPTFARYPGPIPLSFPMARPIPTSRSCPSSTRTSSTCSHLRSGTSETAPRGCPALLSRNPYARFLRLWPVFKLIRTLWTPTASSFHFAFHVPPCWVTGHHSNCVSLLDTQLRYPLSMICRKNEASLWRFSQIIKTAGIILKSHLQSNVFRRSCRTYRYDKRGHNPGMKCKKRFQVFVARKGLIINRRIKWEKEFIIY